MALDLGRLSGILKDVYLPVIRDQLFKGTILLQRLERRTAPLSGRRAVIAMRLGRVQGVGARKVQQDLPRATQPLIEQSFIEPRFNYAVGFIQGQALEATETDVGAFVDATSILFQALTDDLRREINIQLYGDGTGMLASTVAAGTNTANIPVNTIKYIEQEMYVDMWDPATNAYIFQGEMVVDVNPHTNIITIQNPYTFPAGALLYREASKDNTLMGLKGIIDDGTYVDVIQGLSRARYNILKSYVNSGGGTLRPISEKLLNTLFDGIDIKSGTSPTLIVTTHAIRSAIAALLMTIKRIVNEIDLEGGFRGVLYNNVPIVADRDCPSNTLFAINEEHIAIYSMSDIHFREINGSILLPVVDKDEYRVIVKWYSNLGSDYFASHGTLRDIEE